MSNHHEHNDAQDSPSPNGKRRPTQGAPKLSEHEKGVLREEVNAHISQYCNYAALIIIVVAFVAFVLGQADAFFSQIGIMAAIALLAIAAINNPTRK